MPRVGLSTTAVVDIALTLIDEGGPNALTLAGIAHRAGVATPSLYRHVGGLDELRALVGARILEEMTDRLTSAVLGRSRDDAVAALMRACRAYAQQYPARYLAMPLDPLHDPALLAAGTRQLEVVLAVLRGYRITDSAAIHTIRCLRAAIHGFVSLEAGGGFGLPENLDQTYEQLIKIFIASLPRSTKR
jgi:AcrR family transcriptional regulator